MLPSEIYQQVYANAYRICKARCRIYLILEPDVEGFRIRFTEKPIPSKKIFKKLQKSLRSLGDTVIEEQLDSEGDIVDMSLKVIRKIKTPHT